MHLLGGLRQYRLQEGKEETPSQVTVDSQSIKAAAFVREGKGIDGNKKVNGGKRHLLTDTLGLVWSVVVHAANEHDGAMAEKVVGPMQGYLHRVKKILADHAYEKIFTDWVTENMLGVEVEISAVPPSAIGFVPVKWRWIGERTFGCLNFFRRLDKDHEKTVESSETWILWANCQMVLNKLTYSTQLK